MATRIPPRPISSNTGSSDPIVDPPAGLVAGAMVTGAVVSGTGQMIDVALLPVEKAVQQLIDHAVNMGASDLFLAANEQHTAVLVRHLGIIRPISVLPVEFAKKAVSHIKSVAGMDITAHRRPADGRWIYRKDNGDAVDLRISVIPTMYGEDFAMRLLTRGSTLYSLDKLGMGKDQFHAYTNMLSTPAGLILITGPTGSGKSATLYASLLRLNDGKRKINTIEDPIEYAIDGLRQSQINTQMNPPLGFSELLRSVLRQAPDVIMIGEIRDEETARTAVHAANSGMLVFATLHAPSAPGAIQTMRSLGVHSHFLAHSLRGVVAQRLLRTLCPKCKVGFDLSAAPHTFDEVRPWLSGDEGKMLYAPKGCPECHMSGYSGRTGVFEVMSISKSIRDLIAAGATTREIRDKALVEKMGEFRHTTILKVARGQTSTEEVFRVIPSEHLTLDD
jgi:type II secretory ATPase GspE/PulE/Tfp pilus assembly ATPase PilB-like protein